MELILNDLSSKKPAGDIFIGRELMNNFILVCKTAIKNGAERSLRTTENFYNELIAPDYYIGNWLNDPHVDKEYQRYLRSLSHKAPYINSELENELYQRQLNTDFIFDGEQGNGLGAAYLLDGLAVSIKSEDRWHASKLYLVMEYIEDEIEDIITEEILVNHASDHSHLEEHLEWFHTQKLNRIIDGKELWNRRDSLFPHLIFCERVERQLRDLHFGNPIFRQTLKRLMELNLYFSTWKGLFEPDYFPFKVTPESKETLTRYEMEHTFQLPNGEFKLFSWHARMTPGPWRLFFIPDEEYNKGIIGHIGLKLPNVTYPK
jgi:hypothetical protein